ncbi:hypothetical protein HMSSN036_11860 [Paenibacillus macerans]|nr:hypothetical protein HMSSN036_11860 [Paenibacillus macerans]
MIGMDTFVYKKAAGITALSASMSEFEYVKHSHEEYAMGVTLRGVQQYNLDGSFQSSYRDGVMLFIRNRCMMEGPRIGRASIMSWCTSIRNYLWSWPG